MSALLWIAGMFGWAVAGTIVLAASLILDPTLLGEADGERGWRLTPGISAVATILWPLLLVVLVFVLAGEVLAAAAEWLAGRWP